MSKLITIAAASLAAAALAGNAAAGDKWDPLAHPKGAIGWQVERGSLPASSSWTGRPGSSTWNDYARVERGSLPATSSWNGRTPNPFVSRGLRPNPLLHEGRADVY